MHDALVYAASIALTHLKKYPSMPEAANAVRAVLASGKALEVFNAASKA